MKRFKGEFWVNPNFEGSGILKKYFEERFAVCFKLIQDAMVAFLLTWLNLTEIKANHKRLHSGDTNCFIAQLFLHNFHTELVCFDDQILFLSNSVFNPHYMLCLLVFVFLPTINFHRKKMKFCHKKKNNLHM